MLFQFYRVTQRIKCSVDLVLRESRSNAYVKSSFCTPYTQSKSTFNIFISTIYILRLVNVELSTYFIKSVFFFCIYSLKSSSQHLFSFILIRMKYMHKSKYANRIQCMVWFLQFGINTYWLLLKFNFLNFELLLKISSLKYVQIIGTILINQQKAFWFRRIV